MKKLPKKITITLLILSFLTLTIAFFYQQDYFSTKKPIEIPKKRIILNIDETDSTDFTELERLSTSKETVFLDTLAERLIRQWEIVGMSVAVVKDGRLVYAKGFGYADKERNIRMKPHHLLRMASISKLFTATAIMKLVEEGKLSLTDKVFGNQGIIKKYNHLVVDSLVFKIEIQHLLTHTGGWRNQLRTDPMFVPVKVAEIMKVPSPIAFDDVMKYMLAQKGYFPAGAFYDYSNFGYCVLGEVVAQISGKSYQKYLQEDLLLPAKIKRIKIGKNRYKDRFAHETRYYEPKKTSLNLSIYSPKDSASRVYEGNDTESLGAAGGLIASALDIAKFACAIDNFATRPDILREETIKKMAFPISKTDTLGKRVLGWKQVLPDKWWRTGNLASTSSTLSRYNNGYTWVLVTNTGSWRGPYFPYEMEAMMQKALREVKFKDQDLFPLAEKLER